MSENIGIKGRLRQINVHTDRPVTKADGTVLQPGRHAMEDIYPGREAEIRAGVSNIGFKDVLIFDFDGDSSKISKADNDRTDNVRVEVKTVRGRGKESITSYTIGKVGDDKIDKDGDAPFDGIRAGGEKGDEALHLNRAHLMCSTSDGNMRCSFRQVRETADGVFVSPWIVAADGEGLRVGRQ